MESISRWTQVSHDWAIGVIERVLDVSVADILADGRPSCRRTKTPIGLKSGSHRQSEPNLGPIDLKL